MKNLSVNNLIVFAVLIESYAVISIGYVLPVERKAVSPQSYRPSFTL